MTQSTRSPGPTASLMASLHYSGRDWTSRRSGERPLLVLRRRRSFLSDRLREDEAVTGIGAWNIAPLLARSGPVDPHIDRQHLIGVEIKQWFLYMYALSKGACMPRIEELQPLLGEPREDMAAEYKTWLDLTINDHKAVLAKAAIALANHGGGFIIIGFDDHGHRLGSVVRPENVPEISQDAVNAAIHRFATPEISLRALQCRSPHNTGCAPGHRNSWKPDRACYEQA